MTQLDYDLQEYLSNKDKENTCPECGTSCEKEYCSSACFRNSYL